MRSIPLTLAAIASACFTVCVAQAAVPKGVPTLEATKIPSVAVLPLALDDSFCIEKVFSVLIDPKVTGSDQKVAGKLASGWLKMESDRRYFGAINEFERRLRDGHSYSIHWRVKAARAQGVSVRFEYRQQKLGSHVQAQEVAYGKVSGSMQTEFKVQGDEYHQDGQVTAWRVLLIEDGVVVGLQQSFLW